MQSAIVFEKDVVGMVFVYAVSARAGKNQDGRAVMAVCTCLSDVVCDVCALLRGIIKHTRVYFGRTSKTVDENNGFGLEARGCE